MTTYKMRCIFRIKICIFQVERTIFLAGGCHLENKIIFQVKRCVIMSTGEMYISTKEMFISITEMYYYWAILFVPGALRKKVNFVL